MLSWKYSGHTFIWNRRFSFQLLLFEKSVHKLLFNTELLFYCWKSRHTFFSTSDTKLHNIYWIYSYNVISSACLHNYGFTGLDGISNITGSFSCISFCYFSNSAFPYNRIVENCLPILFTLRVNHSPISFTSHITKTMVTWFRETLWNL